MEAALSPATRLNSKSVHCSPDTTFLSGRIERPLVFGSGSTSFCNSAFTSHGLTANRPNRPSCINLPDVVFICLSDSFELCSVPCNTGSLYRA
jgi:hypothetical protein